MRTQHLLPALLILSCAETKAVTLDRPADQAARSEVERSRASTEATGAGRTNPAADAPHNEVTADEAKRPAPAPSREAPAFEGSPAKDSVGFKPADPADLRAKRGEVDDRGGKGGPVERPRSRPPAASPGVKAGAADDNLAFAAYLRFLNESRDLTPYSLDLSRRVIVRVQDRDGRPVHDAQVALQDDVGVFESRRTYADGRALLFMSEHPRASAQGVKVRVAYQGVQESVFVRSDGKHTVDVRLNVARAQAKQVPLDIAFVLDTTGSMGDELARLRQTLEVINFQIQNLSPRPDIRFGMVLYRDVGDDYRARSIPFTRDLKAFMQALNAVQAGGGNDYPEDVQEGLRIAMHDLKWRETGVRLAFLIGDAPPHTDYDQDYTYVSAMKEAAQRGIKIATIGASGLSKEGEVVWRQIAQYTMSPFVFLSYGEQGDSEGSASAVSHHVGSNWVAENLDAIIVRMVKTEMAHLTERGAPVHEDYFSASRTMTMPAEDVLEDLFSQSVKQLLDYSVERIAPRTPTVILPLSSKGKQLGLDKLERRLQVGLSRAPAFQLIERKGVPELLHTLAQQLGERYDEAQVTEVGKMVPAKLAVLGHVEPSKDGPYEMLVKLVRLETGEVLSLSLLKIDRALLL